ncbi:MAG: cytochrome c biogenesis protein CcsA [candidate division Zixibacteria bacterium]|nr:cytochrome c biogenesis protein CcsA [candidate division Zixibacteria bacterium]
MSITQFGDFFIYNAAILAAASAICYALTWRGNDRLKKPARWLFLASAGSITMVCVILMSLIFAHDFSVSYVFSYSSTDLPVYYLFSTFWAGQEGTFLLWLFYLGIMGSILMFTSKNYENGAMFYLNIILISILVIIIKKSPFDLMPGVVPLEGAGLNPLLQDYWMVIHPPTMFIGFAGVAIPFVFALTALTQRTYSDWTDRARVWTLVSWSALGIALVMGGFWAYEVLGWGGFWAWDPVENSSFIPWIFLTTQIHSTLIRKKRNGLNRFALIMVCLTFLSVLYGTFLTRSGVLADFSVHSFIDLGINNFLIGGLFFFTALTAFMFMYRWRDIKSQPSFNSVASRSYLVTLGVVVLFIGGILTLLGTSAPLLTRFTEQTSAVSMDYYALTMNPIGIAVLALLTLFPTFKWDSGIQKRWILIAAGAAAGLTYLSLVVFTSMESQMYRLLVSLAVSAFVSNIYFLFVRSKRGHIAAPYLIHVGVAFMMIGATVSAGHDNGVKLALPEGQEISAFCHKITYTGSEMDGFTEYHYVAMTTDDSSDSFVATLESKYQERDNSVMRKPHVERYLLYDLYVAPLNVQYEEDPSIVGLMDGDVATVGPYEVFFDGFDVSSHGEEEGAPSMAAANLYVTYDGKTDTVAPYIEISADSLVRHSASFDSGRTEVFIANIDATNGAALLKFVGDKIPTLENTPASTLVAEITIKPLINFFWFGNLIIFSGGGILFAQLRQKKRKLKPLDKKQQKPQVAATTA